ncbi:macro domain-containing protein [Streptomyces sp. NBC_01477]|uniref:macro domain-containing protein n=1 Tax=Streptomyces sp. NBC_01477 TaxID=2976015 RepID=UPI002E318994|nr:macro domain-containing protein [Streptomyces sp. NBC_01477]
MPAVRLDVLGPTTLAVDGSAVALPPLTLRLLLRLVAAEGGSVPLPVLYRDVWGEPPGGRIGRGQRTQVQQRVHELRRVLGGGKDDPESVIRTETVVADGVPAAAAAVSAYRLVLAPAQVDCTEFEAAVRQAGRTAPTTAAALLHRALPLWRGRPLPEVAAAPFAAHLVRRLTALHELARRDLLRLETELGHPERALPIAESLAADFPDDPAAAAALLGLRERIRARHGNEVLRREFAGLRVSVVVKRGDLFDEENANLVAGFTDTFDTSTDRDLVISSRSVQGQLLERVLGGDRAGLDQMLRQGLRGVEPVARESPRDKPHGKRARYPIGTVVALNAQGRRAFAVAYSRQGNDLVARSTPDQLRYSLDQLWASVAMYGLLRPVAAPLVGSGLARVHGLNPEEIVMMLVDSFARACRVAVVAPELRIVIPPAVLDRMRLLDVVRFVEALDDFGAGPA